MNGLPDAARSRAVLIGVSRYRHLEDLPAVANNLTGLSERLTGAGSWGLAPEDCVVVAEPPALHEMLAPVAEAARSARDTLLVYFAGHGLTDEQGGLFLGLPGSERGKDFTGVPYGLLRSAILSGRARRHVIVLDCCFSGRALGRMGDSIADQAEVEGSYLLAAASETSVALAPPGEPRTAFTGELLDVLDRGIEGGEAWLTLDAVHRQLRLALGAKGRPVPQKRDRNTAGGLVLARNPAHRPGTATTPPDTDGRWPDPDGLGSAAEYVEALALVRAVSGLTQLAVSRNAPAPLSPRTVGGLTNRDTLPRSWRTVSVYLLACGLPERRLPAWEGAWRRLKASRPAGAAAPEPPPQARGWFPGRRRS